MQLLSNGPRGIQRKQCYFPVVHWQNTAVTKSIFALDAVGHKHQTALAMYRKQIVPTQKTLVVDTLADSCADFVGLLGLLIKLVIVTEHGILDRSLLVL